MAPLPRRALLAVLLMMAPVRARAAQPHLVLSGSQEVKDSFFGRWLQLIYGEALRRLDYRFVYDAYPLRRSSSITDSGHSDGEIHRVPSYGLLYPKLVQVAEAHFSSAVVAYAVRPGLKFAGWEGLRQQPGLKVGILAGTRRLEDKLPPLVGAANISTPVGIDQGMRMLYAGRFDLLINDEALILEWLRHTHDTKIDKARFYRAGLVEPIDFHVFLTPKHAALATRLAEVLRQMKREGLVEQYRRKALLTVNLKPS